MMLTRPRRPDYDTKRAFLVRVAARAARARPTVVETHSAVVVMAGPHAWKMKKPVRLPFADLTTATARAHLCREELRLNRELAGPDVYLGLTAITQADDGTLALDGEGLVVEALVLMRRLDARRMLAARLDAGPAPTLDEVEALADRLVAFYRRAVRPPAAAAHFLDRWSHTGRINSAHLAAMQPWLGPAFSPAFVRHAPGLVTRCRAEIVARAGAGLIVEGHGDLRPEHICLENPPVVFDRLEFDLDLRLADPFEECAYLGIECARFGAGWIGMALMERLASAGMAPPSRTLMCAYGVNRLLTRARLAIDHLRDTAPRAPARWPREARRYLLLARSIAQGAGVSGW
ncbi:MAG: hypothetical protein ACU0CY_13595 [Maritimibacter harenae]